VETTSWPVGTLLHRLRSRVRDELLALGVEKTFPAKSLLIRAGDHGDYVVLLLDSVAKIVVHSENGLDILLGVRVGGDLVGELAVIAGTTRSADVVACGALRARVINRTDFDTFLQRTPGAAYEVSSMLGERLRWADRRRVDFVARNAVARLANVIVEIAETYGASTDGRWELGVPLTQAELGTLAGMAQRTAEKHLMELSRAGVVELRYREITVVDMAELRRHADLPG
jgi:CRP/FNR family transcriptional regulator, cyclic AMP receptor protein